MAVQPKTYLTPEEYLALERAAETKSEYFEGEMVATSGASRPHNLIVTNLVSELRGQLKGRPCEVYAADMRVKIETLRRPMYTYPDLVAVCGEPQLEDEHLDTLLNPTLLVEVLSPSTESYDRGRKFAAYRTLSSLQEVVLVAQDEPLVELYTRQPDQRWLLSEVAGLDAVAQLISVDCELSLREIYDKVPLPASG